MVAQRFGATPQDDLTTEPDRPLDNIGEDTHLLGVDVDGAPIKSAGKGWDNLVDFEDLPWWKRPSKLQDPRPSFDSIIIGSDNPQCKGPEVQKLAATFMLVMNLCTGMHSAFAAPKIGHLSDRHGRRRLLALACCGGLLGELITILAATFPQTVHYRWLLLGSILEGFTGSFTAVGLLIQSYTSDCTPPSKRAVALGYVHACVFIGFALGQFLGGEIVKLTGSLISVLYVCLVAHSVFILLVWFVVPESLSKKKQVAAQEKHHQETQQRAGHVSSSWISWAREKNPLAALSILWPRERGTSTRLRVNLVALAACDMIMMGSAVAASQVIILYVEYVFDWKTPEASRFIAATSLVRVVALMGVFPVINYYFRVRPAARRRRESGFVPLDKNNGADNVDIWILRLALLSDVLGFVGYTVARSPALLVASGMITAFGGLGGATNQSVVTKHVPQDRVGRVLGAFGMLQALVRVVGPVLFNSLYAATVATYPQAIFVALASLFSLALICSFLVTPFVHWEEDADQEPESLDGRSTETFGASGL
ncbi:hypothetical protein UVI_02057680 [Ustilaginoidea virens]|uniref:Tetracycline-efflux transporter n=1 Tax=Ustilaginoidea virens TaxID=1159556 RepID=A0A1B5L2Y9_USTVR|nr:hypothetical protein UVI_02057680 [Ustilaginoidea virens]